MKNNFRVKWGFQGVLIKGTAVTEKKQNDDKTNANVNFKGKQVNIMRNDAFK